MATGVNPPSLESWGLVCPLCRGPLRFPDDGAECRKCSRRYLVDHGIPRLFARGENPWVDYHATNPNYARSEPLPAHPYYAQHVPRETHRLLDLGAGDGVMSEAALDRASLIYCVDASVSGLERLQRRGKTRMLPVGAMADQLPFPDAFFDVVLMAFVIEHVMNDAEILQEVKRVLTPRGRLLVSTDTRFYDRFIHPLSRRLVDPRISAPEATHVNLLTPQELRERLAAAGFRILYEDLWWTGQRFVWWRPILSLMKSFPGSRQRKEALLTSGFFFVAVSADG